VIKFVSDLWFFLGTPFSSTNKTDRHDIAEIIFKVVLNTITQTPIIIHNVLYNSNIKKYHCRNSSKIK